MIANVYHALVSLVVHVIVLSGVFLSLMLSPPSNYIMSRGEKIEYD